MFNSPPIYRDTNTIAIHTAVRTLSLVDEKFLGLMEPVRFGQMLRILYIYIFIAQFLMFDELYCFHWMVARRVSHLILWVADASLIENGANLACFFIYLAAAAVTSATSHQS